MKHPLDFTDKTVVVIGGTNGINLGVAEALAAKGARVAVASRALDKVDAAVEKLSGYGGKAIGFSAEGRDVEVVKAAMLAG